ncbi:MAG: hypothetical protein KatS3mg059_0058 [Thermomicrobiales bacterium]|nr:MAG: hypothetical protein KatS3mg059_0058 [Thermomicrobiales bacterium]
MLASALWAYCGIADVDESQDVRRWGKPEPGFDGWIIGWRPGSPDGGQPETVGRQQHVLDRSGTSRDLLDLDRFGVRLMARCQQR